MDINENAEFNNFVEIAKTFLDELQEAINTEEGINIEEAIEVNPKWQIFLDSLDEGSVKSFKKAVDNLLTCIKHINLDNLYFFIIY